MQASSSLHTCKPKGGREGLKLVTINDILPANINVNAATNFNIPNIDFKNSTLEKK